MDNQLRTLDHIGLFGRGRRSAKRQVGTTRCRAYPIRTISGPRLIPGAGCTPTAPTATSAGAAATRSSQLSYGLPLDATGLVGVKPSHGDFQIKDARLLVPGEPDKSLWQRIARPPRANAYVASAVADEDAVRLIRQGFDQGAAAPGAEIAPMRRLATLDSARNSGIIALVNHLAAHDGLQHLGLAHLFHGQVK